ncbi:MAG TPA: TIGR00730 family Rossman fold protein [Anaerolineaceae bacterium]
MATGMAATNSLHSVCVYCGSADGLAQEYLDSARRMGEVLARGGIRLVYGAGKTGLMGALADGALTAGGEVIGVSPKNFDTPQLLHRGLTRLEIVDDIQQRKARMSALADAFIALPGGYGTFDELFETLTWAQIGLHTKPVGLLNTRFYFDPLLAMVQHALQEGFIYAEHRILLLSDTDPEALLDKIRAFERPAGMERWVERNQK